MNDRSAGRKSKIERAESGRQAAARSLRAAEKTQNPPGKRLETAFGYARNFLNNRFVYLVISPRARGLSVGINLIPERRCNFDCVYCEVNWEAPPRAPSFKIETMVAELETTLAMAYQGKLAKLPKYRAVPPELLQPRHVTLSGDGEPTLCHNLPEVVQAVAHLRALGSLPFFKIVLVSNATGLDQPAVQRALNILTAQDELWLKLDAGTPEYFRRVNRPREPLFDKVLENILLTGRKRPVVIQSLFCELDGQPPPPEEIEEYVKRLRELKEAGAQIALVQIYSALRPTMHAGCRHLSLRTLSGIAVAVREKTGLRAEVF